MRSAQNLVKIANGKPKDYESSIRLPKDRKAKIRLKWAIEKLKDEKLMAMLLRLTNLKDGQRLTKQYLIATVTKTEFQYRKLRAFLAAKGCWVSDTNRFERQGPELASPYMFGSWFEIDLKKLCSKLPKKREFFNKTDVSVSNTEQNTVVETDAAPQGQATVSTATQTKIEGFAVSVVRNWRYMLENGFPIQPHMRQAVRILENQYPDEVEF